MVDRLGFISKMYELICVENVSELSSEESKNFRHLSKLREI